MTYCSTGCLRVPLLFNSLLLQPPSPSTKSELTLQKVRQKLYPGLRPQRSRESTDNIEIPLLAPTVITEVPPEAKNYAIVEQQVVPINPEGVEFISEYPPPSEEKIVSDSPKSSGVFDMGVIKSDESSAKAAAPSTQQITESEARIRERLLERHRIKFSVSSKDKKEEVPPISAVKQPMNKPQPEIPVNRVEQSTGEGVQGAVVIAPPPGNTQGSGVDDSRVEPETGEVEPLPGSKSDPPIAIEKTEAMLVKTSKGQGQKTSSGLYQNWSPSPTESIERFPSSDQKRVTKEGEESSESSADSGSTGKGETVGRCYMDSEEKRERITSERSVMLLNVRCVLLILVHVHVNNLMRIITFITGVYKHVHMCSGQGRPVESPSMNRNMMITTVTRIVGGMIEWKCDLCMFSAVNCISW